MCLQEKLKEQCRYVIKRFCRKAITYPHSNSIQCLLFYTAMPIIFILMFFRMASAMNRQGRGSSRGAHRPNLLSAGARSGPGDPRRLNHTASGRTYPSYESMQLSLPPNSEKQSASIDSDARRLEPRQDAQFIDDDKTAAQSIPRSSIEGNRRGKRGFSGHSRGREVYKDSDHRSFHNNYDSGSFENKFRSESFKNEHGRESFGHGYGKCSTTSLDSGVSVGSASGFSYDDDAYPRRGHRTKPKNYWDSGRSSTRLKDSGYSTDSVRSLSSSVDRCDATTRDMIDSLEDIYLGSDEEDTSGPRSVTGQNPTITPNPIEEILKREAPHVLAKRLIYKKYLQQYIPSMMSIQDKRIKVIDGFAGTGRAMNLEWPTEIEHYETPIIALRVALHHFRQKESSRKDVVFDNNREFDVSGYLDGIGDLEMYAGDIFEIPPTDKHRVILVFFESDKNAYKELVKNVLKVITMYRIRVDEEENFKNGFCKIRCDFKGTKRPNSEYLIACYIVHARIIKVTPVSASDILVLNSQGDNEVPLDRMKRIIDYRKQILITLTSKVEVTNTNGSRAASRRRHHLTKGEVDALEQTLKQNTKNDFYLSLETQGYTNNATGHVLFGANQMCSFKYMKEAMNTVHKSLQEHLICCFTSYKHFKEPFQLRLPEKETEGDKATANAIYQRFRGKEVVVSEVRQYVWLETPYVFRKWPLKILEDIGKLTVKNDDQNRIRGTFPDRRDWNLVFS